MMRINNLRTTYPIILGIPFMHILVLGLCGFFIKRFLVETYNSDVFILLFMLLGNLIICDVLLLRYQLFQRCYLKFQMDHAGIEWYFFRANVQRLKWEEVQTYGVIGYDSKNPEIFAFFSKTPNEKCEAKQKMSLGKNRIVIQIRKESVALLEQYLPNEMRKMLVAIKHKQDCFYRR